MPPPRRGRVPSAAAVLPPDLAAIPAKALPVRRAEDDPGKQPPPVASPACTTSEREHTGSPRVKEPAFLPLMAVQLLSGSESRNLPASAAVIMLHVFDPGMDPTTLSHIGWNPRKLNRLLSIEKFRCLLARVITLAWSRCEVDVLCKCRAGKHRSVAANTILAILFQTYLDPRAIIQVEHLESSTGWKRTCKGECNIAPPSTRILGGGSGSRIILYIIRAGGCGGGSSGVGKDPPHIIAAVCPGP